MKKSILLFASAALFFTACNNSSTEEQPATQETTTETTAPAVDETVAMVTLEGNDAMQYDKTEITVKAGQTVKLTLKHVGKAPVTAMGHNFVLLKPGVDAEAFANDAINAKDNDYIPADREGEIIAHTKMVGGGESTEIEFPAPEPGTYDFLCSFPGHYALMHGKFIVQ